MGFLSGALGITLPFAAYATLTSTIALVIGPAGWIALGLGILHHLGKPNSKRALAAVLGVSAARVIYNSTDGDDAIGE